MRTYPLCYADPRDINYSMEPSSEYVDQGMSQVISIQMASGSQCQLPLDGYNTASMPQFLIPTSTRFPKGESISYGFDKYIWQDGSCVLDYYQDIINLQGSVITVDYLSEKTDGLICAANLYIRSANCGRRCTEEGTTMFVFAGGREISSDEKINGILGPIGGWLSGAVGFSITGYVYWFYKDTIAGDETAKFWLLQRDDRSAFGVFWFMVVAVKYAFEVVDLFLGSNPLAGSLSHLFSLYMLGGGFPFWLYQCWRIYDFYLDNGAYPAFDGTS